MNVFLNWFDISSFLRCFKFHALGMAAQANVIPSVEARSLIRGDSKLDELGDLWRARRQAWKKRLLPGSEAESDVITSMLWKDESGS